MNNVIILNDCIKEYKNNNELKTKEDETFVEKGGQVYF